jgi:outer membrane biosynthesis protein TonB
MPVMINYWNHAFMVSLVCHAAIFSGMLPAVLSGKTMKKTHGKQKEITMLPQKIERIIEKSNNNVNVIPPPYINSLPKKLTLDGNKSIGPNKLEILEKTTKEIILSKAQSDNSSQRIPAYMDYYCMIRELIRNNAYTYYNSAAKGKIYLSFTINAKGALEKIYLNNSANNVLELQDVAIRSIKNAAPFPAFPEELKNNPRLDFNIYVEFQRY